MQCLANKYPQGLTNVVAAFAMKSIRNVVTKGKSKLEVDKVTFPHAETVGNGVFATTDLQQGEIFYEVILPGKCLHAPLACSPYMLPLHAPLACSPYMLALHASLACSCCMLLLPAPVACSPCMLPLHAPVACSYCILPLHAPVACSYCLLPLHAPLACSPCMLVLHACVACSRQCPRC